MTVGRKPWLTAQGMITFSLHHQRSGPGSLVNPIFIYSQNRAKGDGSLHYWFAQCLCPLAGALVLPVGIVETVPGHQGQYPHLFQCDRYIFPSTVLSVCTLNVQD